MEQEHIKHPAPEMTASHKLKTSREAAGHSLEDVATMLRIRLVYLRAIEAGQYDILPAGPYVRGFLRTYANVLKLDEAEVLSLYEQETGKIEETFETKAPSSTDSSRVSFVAAIVFSIVLVIFIGIGWQEYQSRSEKARQTETSTLDAPSQTDSSETKTDTDGAQTSESDETETTGNTLETEETAAEEKDAASTALSQTTANESTDTANSDEAQKPSSQKAASEASAPLVETPLPIAAKREKVKVVNTANETTSTATLSETAPLAETAPQKEEIEELTPPKTEPSQKVASTAQLVAASTPYVAETIEVVAANAATWVRIAYANESRTLFQGIIELGRKLVISGNQDIVLSTGNAGALEVVFSDGLSKSLGEKGEILRNSLLKPSKI